MDDYQKVQSLPGWSDAIAPYSPAFQRGILFVLAHENEYYPDGTVRTEHDPNDPGGTTRYGIDKASHPQLNIETLSLADAVSSYAAYEWIQARGGLLPERLAIAHFDDTVNIGVHYSAEMLQQAVGAAPDGQIGPKTLALAQAAPPEAVEAILSAREAYYKRLRQFPRYGKGWLARVSDLRAYLA